MPDKTAPVPILIHEHPISDRLADSLDDDLAMRIPMIALDVAAMEMHVRWVVQTVHHAHHAEQGGYWWECRKDTCASTARLIRESRLKG